MKICRDEEFTENNDNYAVEKENIGHWVYIGLAQKHNLFYIYFVK